MTFQAEAGRQREGVSSKKTYYLDRQTRKLTFFLRIKINPNIKLFIHVS